MRISITPLILTFNEAPNIRRTLEGVSWAQDIVVLDSISDDETLAHCSEFSQVRVVQRKFDNHQMQWSYGLQETGINSEWVLALDADYVLTPELIEELQALQPPSGINGYRANFVYCINGKPLRGSAYPPVTVLYRRDQAVYVQDGHTQRIAVTGEIGDLKAHILHDDRKPLERWLRSQIYYTQLEARKFSESDAPLKLPDRIRKMRYFAPFLVFIYCLLVQGNILDGRAGIFYAYQRMLAETLLSLHLLDEDVQTQEKPIV